MATTRNPLEQPIEDDAPLTGPDDDGEDEFSPEEDADEPEGLEDEIKS